MKLPNDPERKAGWGWIDLDFLFAGWAEDSIAWHEDITTEGSYAQRIGISNERVVEAFDDQLEYLANKSPGQGLRKETAHLTNTLMRWIQEYFYEGPK